MKKNSVLGKLNMSSAMIEVDSKVFVNSCGTVFFHGIVHFEGCAGIKTMAFNWEHLHFIMILYNSEVISIATGFYLKVHAPIITSHIDFDPLMFALINSVLMSIFRDSVVASYCWHILNTL